MREVPCGPPSRASKGSKSLTEASRIEIFFEGM